MKRLLAILALVLVSACQSLPTNTQPSIRNTQLSIQAVTSIPAKEAFDWLADPKSSWVILDLRIPSVYQRSHLKSAQSLTFDTQFRSILINMDRNQPYIIYSESGEQGKQALEEMRKLGFRNTYNISGGYQAWLAQGYPIAK